MSRKDVYLNEQKNNNQETDKSLGNTHKQMVKKFIVSKILCCVPDTRDSMKERHRNKKQASHESVSLFESNAQVILNRLL